MAPVAAAQGHVEQAARGIARRDNYAVKKVVRVFEGDPWEVLILGRYDGDHRASIVGDPRDAELPYRIWVREDGSGFVTEGW